MIASKTFDKHKMDVFEFWKCCKEQKITLNKKLMALGRKKVKFLGYIVCKDGMDVDPEKIKAFNRFPTPATRQDLKSFIGLMNQIHQFSQAVTKGVCLLQPLLATKKQNIWLPEHQNAFDEKKLGLFRTPLSYTFYPKN